MTSAANRYREAQTDPSQLIDELERRRKLQSQSDARAVDVMYDEVEAEITLMCRYGSESRREKLLPLIEVSVASIRDEQDAAAIKLAAKVSQIVYYLSVWADSVAFRRHVTMPDGEPRDTATLERIVERAEFVQGIAGEFCQHIFNMEYRQLERQLEMQLKRQLTQVRHVEPNPDDVERMKAIDALAEAVIAEDPTGPLALHRAGLATAYQPHDGSVEMVPARLVE